MRILLFSIILLMSHSAFGQETLSKEQLKKFKKEATQKLNALADYVENITNQELTTKNRKFYIAEAKNLFNKDAKIEVAHTKTSKTSYSVNGYFNHIYKTYNKKYRMTIVRFQTQTFRLSKLRAYKNPDGTISYKCVGVVIQYFCGKKKSDSRNFKQCDYKDQTEKEVGIEIKQIKTYRGKQWVLLLGDISVRKTMDL